MNLADSSPNRLALPNERPVKNWQVILAAIFVLLLLGGVVGFAIWGARKNSAEQGQAIRQTFAAGQSPKFALPSKLSRISSNDIQVKTNDGAAVNGLEVTFGGAPESPELQVSNPEILKPGSYTIEVVTEGKRVYKQDFSWGVLALNYPKSVYKPGEDVALDIAVLDEKGGMVCDAGVTLQVVSPSGKKQTLSTKSSQVVAHPECQKKEYVNVPDYEAHFKVQETGHYQIKLTAVTRNGTYWIQDYVPVEENPAFVIERKANTRIYPPVNYPVTLAIYSRDGFKGSVTETLRSDFVLVERSKGHTGQGDFSGQVILDNDSVTPTEPDEDVDSDENRQNSPAVTTEGAHMQLTWSELEVEAGQTKDLFYTYNAPDVSPELYVIGPTNLATIEGITAYSHSRPHQLAMDDLPPAAPVGWWKFDEASGTTGNDSSGNGNTLTLSTSSWTPHGKIGSAWNGTGATSVSRADDDDFDFAAGDSFTLTLWLKSDNASNPVSQEWLLNKSYSGGTQEAGYAIYAKTTGAVCFGMDDDTTWGPDAELCSGSDIYDANWHHILVTKDGGTSEVKLIVDGVVSSTAITPYIATLDSSGDVGQYTSMTLGLDGFPVIAYFDATNQDLKVVKCSDTSCSTASTTTTVDSTGNVGAYSSVVVGTDGYPVISYFDDTNDDLKVVKCGNAACSAGNTIRVLDSTGSVGHATSVALGTDGYPVISYWNATIPVSVKVAKCGNSSCGAGNTITAVHLTGASSISTNSSIAIGSDGYPVIAYQNSSIAADLYLVKCANTSCSSSSPVAVETSENVGSHASVVIGPDGYPVILHFHNNTSSVRLTKCTAADCSSSSGLSFAAGTNYRPSIVLSQSSLPLIAYSAASGASLAVCDESACSSKTISEVDSVGRNTSLVLTGTGTPIIAYYDQTNLDLKVAACRDAQCLAPPLGSLANSRIMYLGDRQGSDGGDEFNGDIDEVKVYRAAMSETQIAAEANNLLGLSVAFGDPFTSQAAYYCVPGSSCTTPVAHWKLDENTGASALDTSGNNRTGTLTGGPTWAPGKLGQSVRFDGTNDYITVADNANMRFDSGSQDFSLFAWVKRNATGATHYVLSKEDADNDGYRLQIDSGDTVTCSVDAIDITSSATVDTNWHHIGCVVDRDGNGRVYIDGVSSGSAVAISSEAMATTSALRLGSRSYTPTSYMNGQIDDVRIYTYARSQSEVIQDMNGGHPVGGSPIGSQVGYWKFEEMAGTVANDSSPLGNNLALSAASWTANGKIGGAWNGTGSVWVSRADDDDFDFDAGDPFSISLWFKSDSATNPGSQEWLLNKSLSNSVQEPGYALYTKSNGRVCFGWDTDSSWKPDNEVCTPSDVYDATWHHLVVARDDGSGKVDLLIDAKLVASAVPPSAGGGSPNTESAPDINSGYGTSIAIGNDGYPVISHIQTYPSSAVKVTKCGNALCSSGNTTTYAGSISGGGESTSIAIGNDGYPVVSYKYNGSLYVVKCSNAACTSSSGTSVDLNFDVGADSSIAIGNDGYPVIAYSGRFAGVKVAKCSNAACTASTLTVVDADAHTSPRSAIAIGADGFPVLSYYSITNGVKITKCGNASCTSGNITSIVGGGGSYNSTISLAIGDDGFPILAYYITSPGDLKVAKCSDNACTSGTTFTVVDAAGDVGRYSSIAIGADNLPVVAYYDATNNELKVTKCGNAACSSGNSAISVDSTNNPGQYVDVAIGADDNPVMSYSGLSVLHCGSESCNYWPVASMANSRSLYVGDRQGSDGGDEFNGDLDDVKIYRATLTASQVQIEFNPGSTVRLGSTSTTSTGVADNSLARTYCMPGDSTTCYPPTHEYRMDENTGTTIADTGSGTSREGLLILGAAFATGRNGAGVQFDSTDSYVDVGSSVELFDETTAFTISAWLYLNAYDAPILCAEGDANTCFESVSNFAGITNGLFYCADGTCTTAPGGGSLDNVLILNKWHFVAMTYNGSNTCRFYVDGRDVTNDSACGETSSGNTHRIGGLTSPTKATNGILDQVRVYDYVRTVAQINWEYNRGRPMAWYRLDECAGTTANDASENGILATISIGGSGSATAVGTCASGNSTHAWNNGETGRVNNAIALDGTDDNIQISDDPRIRFEATTQDFSMFAWVKRASVGTTQYIFSKEDADNDGYRLMINSNNTVTCSVNAVDITSTRAIADTQWHHIGCVVARTGASRVYIDGLPYSNVGFSLQTIPTTSTLVIGSRSYSPTNYLSGLVDDIRLFSTSLPPIQVREIYGNGVATFR